jgi:hypothetical protein
MPQQLAARPKDPPVEEMQVKEQEPGWDRRPSPVLELYRRNSRFIQIALGVLLAGLLVAIVWLRRGGGLG